MKQPQLKSDRLLLRALTLDDAPRIHALASDKRVAEMMASIPHPYPEHAAVDWIRQQAKRWQQQEEVVFGIIELTTDQMMGCISLALENPAEAELTYWVGVDYWGKGVATEAVRLVIPFAFNDLGLKSVTARLLSRNPASGRVLLKAGFQFCGRSEGSCGSKFESLDHYQITQT